MFVQAYRKPDGWGLECVDALPAAAQVRLTYTTEHVIDAVQDTVPVSHRLAVAQYAAYLLCQQLATRYSAERETVIGADVSQTETRSRAYSARAKEFRQAYYVGVGLADPFAKGGASGAGTGGAPSAAAAVVSWPGRRRGMLTRGVL